MKPKVTPWFPPEIKPVHVGIYHRQLAHTSRNGDLVVFAYWDGTHWLIPSADPGVASDPWRPRVIDQSYLFALPWRGLAEKP